jgi:ribosomal protein S18 acetylase RimI-like enzyme
MTELSRTYLDQLENQSRAHRRNATVGAYSAWQSRSQPRKLSELPLKKNNFRIRNAKLTDAPELAALMRELGYQTTSDEMMIRLRSILRDARYSTFVAKIDNGLCAMIGTLTHVSHEHNDLSGKIIALVVSKEQRRSGVGRALIAAAETDFARRGITRVTLTTRFTRKQAHRFYEALGYSQTGLRFAKDIRPIAD